MRVMLPGHCGADCRSRLGSAHEIGGVDFECLGQAIDVIQGDVALAAFNRADVGAMEPGAVGKTLLGEAERLAELADAPTEGAPMIVRAHGKQRWRVCTLWVYRR